MPNWMIITMFITGCVTVYGIVYQISTAIAWNKLDDKTKEKIMKNISNEKGR